MNYCDLILVAGGRSERFHASIPKQFQNISGRPLFLWSLETFLSWPHIGNVVIVVPSEWVEPVRNSFNDLHLSLTAAKSIQVVSGGSSRQESSSIGLKALLEVSKSAPNQWVMIHDAARPCLTPELLDSMWQTCLRNSTDEDFGGVIPAVKASETIKSVDQNGVVVETLPRENLRIVQTPQMLRSDLLAKAFALFRDFQAVDDATLIEQLGEKQGRKFKVLVVDGSYDNLKVTFSEDIDRVSNWLRKRHPQI